MFIADSLEICDPVLAFDEIMEEIGIERYLKPEGYKPLGRPGYCRVNMLKTILFGFMDTGYAALRELEDSCKVNLRYMYLMDYETPSYHCFGDFINEELTESIEEIFRAVMKYICEKEQVDMQHLYIDGSKFEANANKYTWVWKKGTEKARYRLYAKITKVLNELFYSAYGEVQRTVRILSKVSCCRCRIRFVQQLPLLPTAWDGEVHEVPHVRERSER